VAKQILLLHTWKKIGWEDPVISRNGQLIFTGHFSRSGAAGQRTLLFAGKEEISGEGDLLKSW
jgi:hypothetical protein